MSRRTPRPAVILASALAVLGAAGAAFVVMGGGAGGGDSALPTLRPQLAATDADSTPVPGAVTMLSSPPPPGAGVPTVAPAQPEQPNVVHRAGKTLLCPSGTMPMVQIQSAAFSPDLKDGTTFAVGRYKVTVQGRVANETTAAIQLRSLEITIDGRPWHQTTAVRTVAAQDFAPVTFEGFYDSTAPHRAVVDSRLQWQWREPGLRPCGEEGLVEDD
jgi:hypothetical protein